MLPSWPEDVAANATLNEEVLKPDVRPDWTIGVRHSNDEAHGAGMRAPDSMRLDSGHRQGADHTFCRQRDICQGANEEIAEPTTLSTRAMTVSLPWAQGRRPRAFSRELRPLLPAHRARRRVSWTPCEDRVDELE